MDGEVLDTPCLRRAFPLAIKTTPIMDNIAARAVPTADKLMLNSYLTFGSRLLLSGSADSTSSSPLCWPDPAAAPAAGATGSGAEPAAELACAFALDFALALGAGSPSATRFPISSAGGEAFLRRLPVPLHR